MKTEPDERRTDAAVVHRGVVDPSLRLLDLPLQVNGGFGGSSVGHRFAGFGLEVLQSRGDLLRESSSLRGVALTSEHTGEDGITD